jgi:hypothetical protein
VEEKPKPGESGKYGSLGNSRDRRIILNYLTSSILKSVVVRFTPHFSFCKCLSCIYSRKIPCPEQSMKLFLIILLLFPFKPSPTDIPFEFGIVIGSFFQGEELSIKVEDLLIVNKQKVISNTQGKVAIFITQYADYLEVVNYGKTKRFKRVKTKPLKLEVVVNKLKRRTIEYELNKGNIFFIEYNSNGSGILTIEQRTEPVIFF